MDSENDPRFDTHDSESGPQPPAPGGIPPPGDVYGAGHPPPPMIPPVYSYGYPGAPSPEKPIGTGLLTALIILAVVLPIIGPLIAVVVGVAKRSRPGGTTLWVAGLVLLVIGLPVWGILAAIAIPLLLTSRNSAVDEYARNTVRALGSAQFAYYAAHGNYAASLDQLAAESFIDQSLANGELSHGVTIEIVRAEAQSFKIVAHSPSGKAYSIDETGIIEELGAGASQSMSRSRLVGAKL
jgi:type II secretory pathway pseudopilin PulG